MAEAKKYHTEIIPVDSEHSAIFQCLMGSRRKEEIKRIILTCSGGPFFGMDREKLKTVTKADALRHPNWKMGQKITIDCATLMNKGLEVIEAMRLYDLPLEQVDVVIHRQSIVHSMVEFNDGAVMAQMGTPDMRLPIQLAMTYPQRECCPVDPLDLLTCGDLTFAKPDMDAFPCLALARQCAKAAICMVFSASIFSLRRASCWNVVNVFIGIQYNDSCYCVSPRASSLPPQPWWGSRRQGYWSRQTHR
jgi:1-deoxy-D-xylulose-5-phosphate reductoisomerase